MDTVHVTDPNPCKTFNARLLSRTFDQNLDERDGDHKPALTLFTAVLASRRAGLYKHGNQLKNSGELGFVRARWQRRGAGRPLTVDFEALSYISGLVEAFQEFDSDKNGLVTGPELWGLLVSLGLDKSEAEAEACGMLASADADRDGRLQSAVPALEAAGGELMGADELARALGVMGTASVQDCAAIAECLDADGAITIEEFKVMADLL
ncbi:probable calcium-binding protein CML29 [Phragmites australis]|uniref:probable calcium-binding protein CML29 n=1 Tax=Phragmites australis TaxID=29695 RepID=UPI002D78002B|nr:probable calcium-binding protein CML29 [Phragmites australis]